MERRVEANLPSKYESRAIDHGDDWKPLTNESKEEGIVTVTEVGIPPPDGGIKAWLVLAGISCLNFCTFGMASSWGAFQSYYQRTLLQDESPSAIAWIGSIQFALIFMPGLFAGRLVDFGYFKLPVGIAGAVLSLTTLLTAQCEEYWQFLLCQGIAFGLACGFIFPPTFVVLPQWFHKRRATAFGVSACGTSLGGLLIPIWVRYLIPAVGFQWTMRILALILAVLVTFAVTVTRPRLPPRPVSRFVNFQQLRNKAFTAYTLSMTWSFLGMYTVLTFVAVAATEAGIDPSKTFFLVSMLNGASIVGRFTSGFIADRFGALNLMIPFMTAAGSLSFAFPAADSYGAFAAVSLLYGISFGAFIGLLPNPAVNMGPLETAGERVGLALTGVSLACLVGTPISGAIRSASGGFVGPGAYAGSCQFVGVILLIATKRLATGAWWKSKI